MRLCSVHGNIYLLIHFRGYSFIDVYIITYSTKSTLCFNRIYVYKPHIQWLSLNILFIEFDFSLAIKNAEDNGPTRRDPASSDLLCDGEQ